MTATHPVDPASDPLAPGAQPAAIAAALWPEDRSRFLESYDRELGRARSTLDLTSLFAMLEQWRGLAAMQTRPEQYRRNLRRAAELITGERSPADEPIEVTRAKAGAQVPYELDAPALEEFRSKVVALPEDGRAEVEDVLDRLSRQPWDSLPMNEANPTGQYRFVPFDAAGGYGFVTLVVLEAERRVSMVDLVWFADG